MENNKKTDALEDLGPDHEKELCLEKLKQHFSFLHGK
jgi:hypothetical protein